MLKSLPAAIALLLISSGVSYGQESVVCDEPHIAKIEADLAALTTLSEKQRRKATNKLEKAKKSLANNKIKQCQKKLEKVVKRLEKAAPSEEPDMPAEPNGT